MPEYYINKLNTYRTMVSLSYDKDEIEYRLTLVNELRTALRTQPVRFIINFTEVDGVTCLIRFLSEMVPEVRESRVHTSAIGCVKALMNNTQGRAAVLKHPDAINVIAQSLKCNNLRTKISALEILGAVCLVPGGHKKVLEAMIHFQNFAHERTRFQHIMNDLGSSMLGQHAEFEVEFKKINHRLLQLCHIRWPRQGSPRVQVAREVRAPPPRHPAAHRRSEDSLRR